VRQLAWTNETSLLYTVSEDHSRELHILAASFPDAAKLKDQTGRSNVQRFSETGRGGTAEVEVLMRLRKSGAEAAKFYREVLARVS
jgi:hypothetical protein